MSKRAWTSSVLLHGSAVLFIGFWLFLSRDELKPKPDLVTVKLFSVEPVHPDPSHDRPRPHAQPPKLPGEGEAPEEKPARSSDVEKTAEKKTFPDYLSRVHQHLSEYQIYPSEARKQHLEGRVEIELTIDEHGRVLQKRVISAGNSQVLVEAALSSIEEASPLPLPPPGFPGKIVVPIEFSLSEKK